jgi:hypothetical protein
VEPPINQWTSEYSTATSTRFVMNYYHSKIIVAVPTADVIKLKGKNFAKVEGKIKEEARHRSIPF